MKFIGWLSAVAIILTASTVLAGPLQVNIPNIDFGQLKEGPPVLKTVILTNAGNQPIDIVNVKSSCACTTTTLGKGTLQPGESTDLEIKYTTFKYAGKFDKTVTISYGQDGNEQSIIHLLGIVDPIPMGIIELDPRKVDLGTLSAGKENRVILPIKNKGDAPLNLSRVQSRKLKLVYFDAGKNGPVVIPAGETIELPIVVQPPRAGQFLDIVMIFSNARNDVGEGYKAVLSGQAE